ncbi:unnamed protein product [Pseudo-nitzschia multistriata]|uniref:Uncharacterized protein n=1 Tax=Pseudo-nitzschia multistriata TaxID=183589 RepID=A0A448ZGE9_9STRA|nr:unnamed protein product [Pseudo-nitzschia multistriata]
MECVAADPDETGAESVSVSSYHRFVDNGIENANEDVNKNGGGCEHECFEDECDQGNGSESEDEEKRGNDRGNKERCGWSKSCHCCFRCCPLHKTIPEPQSLCTQPCVEAGSVQAAAAAATATRLSDRLTFLAPASPERSPGVWMLINAFMLVWSLSLGLYMTLLYWWYDKQGKRGAGKDAGAYSGYNYVIDDDDDYYNYYQYEDSSRASKETTTYYLVWSLLTMLVWMAEISLRAAFPAVDTVLVVVGNHNRSGGPAATNGLSFPAPKQTEYRAMEETRDDSEDRPPREGNRGHDNDNDSDTDHDRGGRRMAVAASGGTPGIPSDRSSGSSVHQHQHQHPAGNTRVALLPSHSIVTVVDKVQRRSKKRTALIVTELFLAVFFLYRTVENCWNYWGWGDEDGDDGRSSGSSSDGGLFFTMLEQQLDVWVGVLAYAYVTYETYHAYHSSTASRRELQRSLSTVPTALSLATAAGPGVVPRQWTGVPPLYGGGSGSTDSDSDRGLLPNASDVVAGVAATDTDSGESGTTVSTAVAAGERPPASQ